MTFWGDNSKIAERLQAIQNMALKEDDILLAAYPKCSEIPFVYHYSISITIF